MVGGCGFSTSITLCWYTCRSSCVRYQWQNTTENEISDNGPDTGLVHMPTVTGKILIRKYTTDPTFKERGGGSVLKTSVTSFPIHKKSYPKSASD